MKNEFEMLSRDELLELLDNQKEELKRAKEELLETKLKLEDKRINLSQAGSLADAAMRLNSIFEVAQQAADQYLWNIKYQNQLSSELPMPDQELTNIDELEAEIESLKRLEMEMEPLWQKALASVDASLDANLTFPESEAEFTHQDYMTNHETWDREALESLIYQEEEIVFEEREPFEPMCWSESTKRFIDSEKEFQDRIFGWYSNVQEGALLMAV